MRFTDSLRLLVLIAGAMVLLGGCGKAQQAPRPATRTSPPQAPQPASQPPHEPPGVPSPQPRTPDKPSSSDSYNLPRVLPSEPGRRLQDRRRYQWISA